MDQGITPRPGQNIFTAVQKCRSGEVSEDVARTLQGSGLLRGIIYVRRPEKMNIVFARALKGTWRDAEKHIKEILPPQAALRFANAFGIDFIVSGQLPQTWADDQLAKRADLFEDVYEAEVIPSKRYRWGTPTKPSDIRGNAKLTPTMEDIATFLRDQKRTRLVYDSSKLPSLSCLAVITTDDVEWAEIWEDLDEEEQAPVRDVFRKRGHRVNMDAMTMDRDAIDVASDYVFCEFDSIGVSDQQCSFIPAMNQAYKWRRKIIEKRGVQQVRLIPCAVIVESIDHYNELQESKDRMSKFTPTVNLPYAGEVLDDYMPFPIWNVVICGGSRSGKSVIAYVLAASLLKQLGYDVLYVNYKNSDQTPTLKSPPRKEALEFARIIQYVTGEAVNLITPDKIRTTISAEDKAGAYYTECTCDWRPARVLEAITEVRQTKSRTARPGMFVFLDEILNQKDRDTDLVRIESSTNQLATLNTYLAILHQSLGNFEADAASNILDQSTVVLAANLPRKDEDRMKRLLSRADKTSLPISPVQFADLARFGTGEFVFLPKQPQARLVGHPVRHKIPVYGFLHNLGSTPEEWQWNTKTPLVSC